MRQQEFIRIHVKGSLDASSCLTSPTQLITAMAYILQKTAIPSGSGHLLLELSGLRPYQDYHVFSIPNCSKHIICFSQAEISQNSLLIPFAPKIRTSHFSLQYFSFPSAFYRIRMSISLRSLA